MDRNERTQFLKEHGIIAIVRADQGGDILIRAIEALVNGGIRCVEVTMTTPGALQCLEQASREFEGANVLLGVGSVLDSETARLAILSGAEYLVCPVTVGETIRMGHRYGVPVLPGAFTPTEIFHAWELGGDLIKVFPATLGGLDYIKAVMAPMPNIPLVPTGGVTVDNLHTFVAAGVAAVGVGTALVSRESLVSEDFEGIKMRARRFAEAYAIAKADSQG
tara:strand:+ start:434 stop:1096 length:663 start_codon:yes stop_codon:yes gene_type:complete